MRRFLEIALGLMVAIVGVWACDDAIFRVRRNATPAWTVPSQKVRHVKSGKVGKILAANGGRIEVEIDGAVIGCEPIEVVPIK